jgi:hypothetical protein
MHAVNFEPEEGTAKKKKPEETVTLGQQNKRRHKNML